MDSWNESIPLHPWLYMSVLRPSTAKIYGLGYYFQKFRCSATKLKFLCPLGYDIKRGLTLFRLDYKQFSFCMSKGVFIQVDWIRLFSRSEQTYKELLRQQDDLSIYIANSQRWNIYRDSLESLYSALIYSKHIWFRSPRKRLHC